MATPREWLAAARPRTLPAAAAPVIAGTGAAASIDGANVPRAVLALGVALALQVGVNYANDFSDGVRGTDLNRVGPVRLTAAGLASPAAVRLAAIASLAVGAVIGASLIVVSHQWWLIVVGIAAVAAAWGYTGGRRPYGYRGLGEVGVFTFFGLVATLGTTWTQALALPWTAYAAAVGIGLLACALLMVNNLRDIPTDALVGKRTLAVRLGERRARRAYVVMVVTPLILGLICMFAAPWAGLVALLALPTALLSITVLAGASGRALIPVLAGTGMLELGYGVLLGVGLAL